METIIKTTWWENTKIFVSDFISYVARPYYIADPPGEPPHKLTLFIRLWLLDILLTVVSMAVVFVLLFVATQLLHDDFFRQVIVNKPPRNPSALEYLLLGGIAVPILEELGFRLYLKYRPVYLAVSVGILAFALMPGREISLELSIYQTSQWWGNLGVGTITGICTYLVARQPKINAWLAKTWSAHFKLIYYFSAFFFGIIHITRACHVTYFTLFTAPIITLPQIAAGLLLGYTRMRYGLIWAILIHAMNNRVYISLIEVLFNVEIL